MTVYPVTENFAAEIGDVDLSKPLSDADRTEIETAFNHYSVLVFPDQHLSTDQHLDFARNFGPLETTIHAARSDAKLRVRAEIADVSNLNPDEAIWGEKSRKRMFEMGNRMWHTDSSFRRLPAKASLLYSRSIPPVGGQTEFADMRQFVYTHRWREHDLVMWDNRCTMHRGKGYDDLRWPRDMQRATLSDVAPTCEQEGIKVPATA